MGLVSIILSIEFDKSKGVPKNKIDNVKHYCNSKFLVLGNFGGCRRIALQFLWPC